MSKSVMMNDETVEEASSGANMSDVFVYGTLMSPDVFEAVIGRKPTYACTKAVLRSEEYTRCACTDGRVYPALVPVRRDSSTTSTAPVHGRVITGLSARDHIILDAFEDEYEKVLLHVTCFDEDGTAATTTRACLTYVYRRVEPWCTDSPWNYDEFVRLHLDAYLEGCAEFKLEIEEELARLRGDNDI